VPGHNFIGIEWKAKWVKQAQQKIIREKLDNVIVLCGNFSLLFPILFAPKSLQVISLNFPDPWWKRHHAKKKIISSCFVDLIESRLASGGILFFQSDVKELFDEYVACFLQNKNFQISKDPIELANFNPMQAQSHREKKCLENGMPIYRIILSKRN